MTWTYDPTQLADSEKDRVRLEIGDTDEGDQLLQDEEILHALSVERDFWGACARCCEQIGRVFLRKANRQLGRMLRIEYTTTARQWDEMAQRLRKKSLGTAVPYVGGRSIQEKVDLQADTGAVQPLFSKRLDENPHADSRSPDHDPY